MALARDYALCAGAEGKSAHSITAVIRSLGYLDDYLHLIGVTSNVAEIGPNELRAFILYLR